MHCEAYDAALCIHPLANRRGGRRAWKRPRATEHSAVDRWRIHAPHRGLGFALVRDAAIAGFVAAG
jgi:hypothetical protein